MKNTLNLYVGIAALLFISCYEDKGNYDYKDIERLDIEFEERYISTSLGDTVEVKPEYSQDMEKNAEHYQFCWTLEGKTRAGWQDKDFKWIVDTIISEAKLVLEVRDTRNGLLYMGQLTINITGLYENEYSWMILSDKEGKSQLSFLSVLATLDEDETPQGSEQIHYKKAKFIPKAFKGELGEGPIALQEHFREGIDWSEKIVGNVCVFQQSGAVDLEGVGFTKEIDMAEAFEGGVYPNGEIYPGTFMDAADIVADREGKLYSRIKLATTVYNSDYFLQEPLALEGETEALEKCRVCRGFYKENRFGLQVIYDGGKKRFLYVKDKGEDWNSVRGAGKIIPVEVSEDARVPGTVPLDDHSGYELLYLSQYQTGETYDYGFYEVLQEETGNRIYLQSFISAAESDGASRVISKIKKKEITGLPSMPSHIAFPLYSPEENAFFSIGRNLYRLDLVNETEPAQLYYSFDAEITAMDCQGKGNAHLAVGLADGSFYVLGINHAKNIKAEHKIIYQAPEKVGRIIDIKYKNNELWNY